MYFILHSVWLDGSHLVSWIMKALPRAIAWAWRTWTVRNRGVLRQRRRHELEGRKGCGDTA